MALNINRNQSNQNLFTSLLFHNENTILSLARIHCSVQEITSRNPIWSKFDISKCWCDLELRSRAPKSIGQNPSTGHRNEAT